MIKNLKEERENKVLQILGSFLVMIIVVLTIKYVFNYNLSGFMIIIIYCLASIICYPLYKNSELPWLGSPPIPFKKWILYNIGFGLLTFVFLLLFKFLFLD